MRAIFDCTAVLRFIEQVFSHAVSHVTCIQEPAEFSWSTKIQGEQKCILIIDLARSVS